VLIVDDVHLLVNKRKTQVEFLHTFNSLAETGRQVILASDAPPKAMDDLDPALVGRFMSGLVTGIRKPDYETRLGIVRLYARCQGNRIRGDILNFLAQSVRGSARELIGALKQIEIHTQVAGAPLSLQEARVALAELIREQERQISLERVKGVVAEHFGISPEALLSAARQRHVVRARQVAMFLARQYTKKTLGEIGRYFGKRNHTTVRSALARVEGLLGEPGEKLEVEVQQLRELLES
jgi:chromosomal replication initiator protein